MTNFYRRLTGLILFVAVISAAVIYFTVDINTLEHLTMFKPRAIALAIGVLAVGLLFDGIRLVHMVGISHDRITLKQTMPVVFGNYFLALITPGMAGGALAQLLFLRRAGVTTGTATVFVVVRTLMSILFLLVCLPFVFYFDRDLLPWISAEMLAGISLFLLLLIVGSAWLGRTQWIKWMLKKIGRRCKKKHRRLMFTTYRDVVSAVKLLRTAPKKVLLIFVESGISLIALYSVVPALFWGLGVEFDIFDVMGRMILLNLLLYFAPTPGGSGIAEGGFILLFAPFLPSGVVGIVAVAWRFIAEYLPFLVGFYFTIKAFGEDFMHRKHLSNMGDD